ncbi:MAG: hypothetical protein CMH49_04410 [Myxococcales bacterium]|nr:hypothetical protein [Myxococcales bacterium]
MPKGSPITLVECELHELEQYTQALSAMKNEECTAIIVRNAFSRVLMQKACAQLSSDKIQAQLKSPNQGMPGGELLTLGAAATPTMTALNGPSNEMYIESAQHAQEWESSIFGEVNVSSKVADIISQLNHKKPAQAAPFQADDLGDWLPFNYRILPPNTQIYAHHDMHYRLPIYDLLADGYNQKQLLSWFITGQESLEGGELIIYGLRSDDPNPPMLPSRFVDITALEKEYYKQSLHLKSGDFVIFNSGLHVHRVSSVQQEQSRITFGGFATFALDQSHMIYWS